ncbi:hypothetical protein C8A00DRAFT_33633 [Chaetomidium leptoderma]|uniref:Monocarboxylate transporter n=1 Tax=Chaetomidium leptoderma TaxID=669021 RepID=A0AAN6VL69_9PEZI|nr:hypothetical protein C8A00DRAFT_33633 [Chaetomidium leptoderma]
MLKVNTRLEFVPSNTASLVAPPPDGGFWAWMTVVSGFFAILNTWGVFISFGVFQTHYLTTLSRPPSDIAFRHRLDRLHLGLPGHVGCGLVCCQGQGDAAQEGPDVRLTFTGVFFPFFYLASYARDIQNLSNPDSLNLLLVLNGVGVVGRLLPGFLALRFGTFNVFTTLVAATSLTLYCSLSGAGSCREVKRRREGLKLWAKI